MKKLIISALLLFSIVGLLISSAFAWLGATVPVNVEFSASVLTGYFAGGDGTEEHPYQIAKDIHVYNLAWLQYMGYFNEVDETTGKINQTYFELTADIDMKDMYLPPIGTEENPFVGNFNGNYKTITNLNVANKIGAGENEIKDKPLSVNALKDTAAIVGFFGVVGQWNGAPADAEIDKSTISVYNLYLDNLNVRTVTQKSLIGLLAGYVNGDLENVGIGTSSINVGSEVQNNINDTINAISIYSLIGAYDNQFVEWVEAPEGSGGVGGGTTGGEGIGFGGSMDMYSLIRRLTYIFSENIANRNTYPAEMYYGGTRANAAIKKSYAPDYTHKGTRTSYLGEGTVLALNTDTDTMFTGDDFNNTLDGVNFLTNTYYHNHSEEIINAGNTGYIAGGGNANSSTIRMRINKLASGQYKGIYRSLGTSENTNATFDRGQFQALTITPDGTTYVITDDKNSSATTAVSLQNTKKTNQELKLRQYDNVMQGLNTMLTASNGMIYGMRFYNGQEITSADTADDIKVTTITNPKIQGVNLSSYELLDGAINFRLISPGYITTIAGTYGEQTGDHDIFSLYRLERNENGEIDTKSSFLIEKIWVKYGSDGKKINDIKYNDEGSTTTGYTCVFDMKKMKTLSEINAAYYFELPVTAGDYALTSPKTTNDDGTTKTSRGAYLMYLDIGANGDISIGSGSGSGGGTGTQYVHSINGINFVDKDKIGRVLAEGESIVTEYDATNPSAAYDVITFNLTLTTAGTNASGIAVGFNRTGAQSMTYSITNGDDFTVTPYSDDATLKANTTQTVAQTAFIKRKEDEWEEIVEQT